MKKAVYYLLLFLLVSWTVSLAANKIYKYAVGGNIPTEVGLVAVAVADIATFCIFVWRGYCPVSRNYVRSRPVRVAFWCVAASLGTIIPSMWLDEHLAFLPNISQADESLFGSPLGYLAVVVCVPVCEEVVFRGAVIRSLLGWRDRKALAVVISAAIFALAHVNPAQMSHAFLLGLLLGWVFVRTGSVVPGIVIHGTNNLAVFILGGVMSASGDVTLSDLYGGNALHVGLGILFSLFILLPALLQLHVSMKR